MLICASDDDISALEDCDGDFFAGVPFGGGAFFRALAYAGEGVRVVPVVHDFYAGVDAWFEACENVVSFGEEFKECASFNFVGYFEVGVDEDRFAWFWFWVWFWFWFCIVVVVVVVVVDFNEVVVYDLNDLVILILIFSCCWIYVGFCFQNF